MPEPTHPPYVQNAKTIPRMLQRWLDVNAQNGPLTRTRKYVTFPAFSITFNYRGYDTIIGEYLYYSPKRFSLIVDPSTLPPYPSYTLCVSWIDDGVVYRYRIFDSLYPNILFDIPAYKGERIGNYFKFEVWSSNTITITQTDDVTFYIGIG